MNESEKENAILYVNKGAEVYIYACEFVFDGKHKLFIRPLSLWKRLRRKLKQIIEKLRR